MKYLISLLLLTSVLSNGYSQKKIVIGTRIRTESGVCETEQTEKAILLEIKLKENFRVLKKFTISNCMNFYEFPKYPGSFRVTVTSTNYQPGVLEFDILPSTSDTLMLNEIVLQKEKVVNLEKITVLSAKKEFMKVEADKTTILVKSNEMLSEGSAYDAILKIPGVLADPSGNIVQSGKVSAVWIDGQPNGLSGQDLVNFLNNLPASVIEKIEVISNPGAAYDAGTAGGIINIITVSKAMKGLSGTLNSYYGRSRYNKPGSSLLLNGRIKKVTWQVSGGYSENNTDETKRLSNSFTDINPAVNVNQLYETNRSARAFFARTSLDYAVNKKISIGFKYNLNTNADNAVTNGLMLGDNALSTFNFTSLSKPEEQSRLSNLFVYYRQKLDSAGSEINVSYNASIFDKDNLNSVLQSTVLFPSPKTYSGSIARNNLAVNTESVKADLTVPYKKMRMVFNAGMKFSYTKVNSDGWYNLNSPDVNILSNPVYTDELRFNYNQANYAFYTEVKKQIRRLSLNAGLRYESFRIISGTGNNHSAYNQNISNLFPSANILYEMNRAMNLSVSYTRKIEQPGYEELDPNLKGYFDSYTNVQGNPALRPNYYNNFESKLTLFKYVYFGFNYSKSKSENLLVQENTGNFKTTQTYKVFEGLKNTGFTFGMPLPFAVFSEGLNFFKKNINIDRTNFLYFTAGYNLYRINNAEEYISSFTPSFSYNVYSQIILPLDIKLGLNYAHAGKGTFQIYQVNKPVQRLDFTLSRSFLNKSLKVTFSARDILNTVELNVLTHARNISADYSVLRDTRSFRIGLSYNFGKFSALHKQKDKPEDEEEVKRIERKADIVPAGN